MRILPIIFIYLLCVYLSWMPLFHPNAWISWDLGAHLSRTLSTVDELKQGQFPPYFDFNYHLYPGYSWNIFYPPLDNFIMSFFQYTQGSLNNVLKSTSFVILVLSTLISFFSFKNLGISRAKLLTLSLMYSCSIYMVNNIFIRGAIPESLAICFAPLFISSLLKRTDPKSFLVMGLASAGILLSNIPSFIACAIVALVFAAFRKDSISFFIKSFFVCLLLSSFYIFPLIYSLYGQSFHLINANFFQMMSDRSLGLYDLLSGEKIKTGILKDLSLGIGWPIFLLLLLALYNNIKKSIFIPLLVLTFIVISGANYSFLPTILQKLSLLQFTWRLVPYLLLLILVQIAESDKVKNKHLLACLFLTSLMSTSISVEKTSSYNITPENYSMGAFEDYALTNARKIDLPNGKMLCLDSQNVETLVNFTEKRNSSGMPVFEFNSKTDGKCIIPVMAYNSLMLDGERNIIDGYFYHSTLKGDNRAEVKRTVAFELMYGLGALLSLITLIFIIYKFSNKVRRGFFTSHFEVAKK